MFHGVIAFWLVNFVYKSIHKLTKKNGTQSKWNKGQISFASTQTAWHGLGVKI